MNVLLTGVAPDDLDVSRWMGALNNLPFLSSIHLEVSEEKELRGQRMRQFKISMKIEPNADVRGWPGLDDLRTPTDPIARGTLDGAKIMTVVPMAPVKTAEIDTAPALINEEATGTATAAAKENEVKE